MTNLVAAIDKFRNWYVSKALPLWARAGADASGAFYESLDFSGAPIAGQHRRVRVQSRQIHTFTQAARLGWLPDGDKIAARGFQRLIETACPDGGAHGCVNAIDDDGAIVDAKRDLYDQAFLLLAAAARLGDTSDPAAQTIIDRTLSFLDAELASPNGGYLEDDRASLPRRQNPHMHLFEALMALYAASGDPAFLARARSIEALFNARFLDRNEKVLREMFADDWTIDATLGARIEPGHMMEWVFLLDRFEALTGDDRTDEKRLLFNAASAIAARDRPFLPNGFLFGAPAAHSARRLWPQTEALRAALVMARGGEPLAAEYAATLIEALFSSYLDQETPGLWCDEYDAAGRAIAKDVPASILYHLHEAVSCAAECRHKIG